MEDRPSHLVRLEKVEKVNVTPSSGVKKRPYIDLTNVPKKILMKNLMSKSPIEVAQKSDRKKKIVSYIDRLAKKQSNLIYNMTVLKKSKKPKVKKGNIRKKSEVKKLKTVRRNDSKSQNTAKRIERNLTFEDHDSMFCYNDSTKNTSKANVANAIYGLRNRNTGNTGKVYSKNVKSFIENCSGISEKYSKVKKLPKKQPETSFDIYKRKLSTNEAKKIVITTAKKPAKNNLIDYVNLCYKIKSRDILIGGEKNHTQVNKTKQAFVNYL
jgi:hypothetical protein